MSKQAEDILQRYWGHASFRPLQKEIIASVLDGNDTLALLPTGGGKSVCFQVPALMQSGLCLIISPLIALMQDQVENLNKKGIRAMAITSAMSRTELDVAFNNCVHGHYKFLYVSPERLKTDLFKAKLPALNVKLIAVDEAHCISQWGYDFRPSYLEIAALREYLPLVPVIAVTASATREVVEDIQKKLQFKRPNIFRASFERKNLNYIVQQEEDKTNRLLKICNNVKGTGIVYVRNRRRTQEIAQFLITQGIPSDFYHAGILPEQRMLKQSAWITNKIRVIVATNAFGMGIDKPDVRFVVHLDLPDSLEAYFQEAGRGGRDGKTAYATILMQDADIIQLQENLNNSFPGPAEMKQVYQAIANYYQVAVGSGLGLSVDFNMEELCEKYNLKQQLVFNSIRFLEKEGYLSLSDASFEPARIHIPVHKEDLYNFQVKNEKYDNLIKSLLRSYGGVMEQFVAMNEYQLAKRCGCAVSELQKQLTRLHELEMVYYVPRRQFPRLNFTANRIDAKHLYFSKENYELLKDQAQKRVTSVIQYVNESRICRSRQLLKYFNEDEFEDCEHCDVCLRRKKKLRSLNVQEVEVQIAKLLQARSYRLDELVSSLYRYDKSIVMDTINQMTDDGKLEQNNQQYLKIRKADK